MLMEEMACIKECYQICEATGLMSLSDAEIEIAIRNV